MTSKRRSKVILFSLPVDTEDNLQESKKKEFQDF